VNPNFEKNNPEKNEYRLLADIPENVDHLLVLTDPSHTTTVIRNAIKRGIGNIWIQQKSDTPEALELCRDQNINLITNHCIFMFSHPEGFHKFHYGMKKFFGSVPK
jgi:predicted CoA-binding protein